jgi:hypothetical protein
MHTHGNQPLPPWLMERMNSSILESMQWDRIIKLPGSRYSNLEAIYSYFPFLFPFPLWNFNLIINVYIFISTFHNAIYIPS